MKQLNYSECNWNPFYNTVIGHIRQLITTKIRKSMHVRGMLLLSWFIWRCSDLVLSGGFTDAQHTVDTSPEFTSVVVGLQNFFYKGFDHRLQRIVLLRQGNSLQISHTQKFAWPFYRHIILFDNVRCSHAKKLRLAKNSVFFNLWRFSVCPRITFPAPSVNLVSRNLEQH